MEIGDETGGDVIDATSATMGTVNNFVNIGYVMRESGYYGEQDMKNEC